MSIGEQKFAKSIHRIGLEKVHGKMYIMKEHVWVSTIYASIQMHTFTPFSMSFLKSPIYFRWWLIQVSHLPDTAQHGSTRPRLSNETKGCGDCSLNLTLVEVRKSKIPLLIIFEIHKISIKKESFVEFGSYRNFFFYFMVGAVAQGEVKKRDLMF